MGTYGSRSLAVGGSAIVKAMDKIVAKGTKIAAHLLEASEADIEFKDGKFTVAGTDRSKTVRRGRADRLCAAQLPASTSSSPASTRPRSTTRRTSPSRRAPISPRSRSTPIPGTVEVVNFTAGDDFGRIINPMIVEGQVHGGLAQGIGQALLEGCVYDKETGQLLTGSYMDYAMPRADDLPSFELSTNVTLCTHNPLGVKGCGEAGAIGAPAAIINAIVDALKPLGVAACRHAGDAGAAVARHPTAPSRRSPRNRERHRCTNSTITSPTSLADAAKLLGADEEAKLVAGGMTLIPTLKQRLAKPSDLVDLGAIAELKGIKRGGRRASSSAR